MSEGGKFDPRRRLCPDGACVGVIGDDGRCRVCGRSAGGGGKDAAAAAGFVPATVDADDGAGGGGEAEPGDDDGAAAGPDDGAAEAGAVKGAAAFDPHRRLCPDGDCLGVIGAEGVCNVCGKKAD